MINLHLESKNPLNLHIGGDIRVKNISIYMTFLLDDEERIMINLIQDQAAVGNVKVLLSLVELFNCESCTAAASSRHPAARTQKVNKNVQEKDFIKAKS